MSDSTPIERRMFNRREAATYLGIGLRMFDSITAKGEILKVSIGARVLFDRSDLDAYIERLKASA